MPYGSICCIYYQLKYSSPAPNRSNKSINKSHIKEPIYLSDNGGLGKKSSGELAEKDKTERATGLGRRISYRKVGSN